MAGHKLVFAAALCAGLGAAGAAGMAESEPLAVAVPVSQQSFPPKPEEKPTERGKPAPEPLAAADEGAGGQETRVAAAEPGEGAQLPASGSGDSTPDGPLREHATPPAAEEDEEYLPLDLPAADAPAGDIPAVEAVLGLDPEPDPESRGAFFVHTEILGLPDSEGMVSASLCTRQTFTKSGCRTKKVPARRDRVSITFDGVAPGLYAVQVHHDQNGNGKMDFTFLGLPKEPYGFSRDAKPMLAPPKFKKASFEVKDRDVSLVINLQNT